MTGHSGGVDQVLLARRRARRGLVGITAAGLVALALVAALAAVTLGAHGRAHTAGAGARATPTPVPGWDWSGEAALAGKPMVDLPVQAAAPQPLAPGPRQVALRLPSATGVIDDIPAGFPATAPGAVAALAALDTQALRGGDPRFYGETYARMSAPGAPPASAARLTAVLTSTRSSAGLPVSGPVAGLTINWTPTQAQVKGVLDNGRYAVVCVLGQLSADYQGRVVDVGLGDCQAMRFEQAGSAQGQWLISPGPAAAAAPDAWPGSQDALNAGYQEIAQ